MTTTSKSKTHDTHNDNHSTKQSHARHDTDQKGHSSHATSEKHGRQGFASMDADKQREIAAKGGRASHR